MPATTGMVRMKIWLRRSVWLLLTSWSTYSCEVASRGYFFTRLAYSLGERVASSTREYAALTSALSASFIKRVSRLNSVGLMALGTAFCMPFCWIPTLTMSDM